ncbi:MAG: ABC transporter permease [Saprospiraceae bacterium]|nr:ABC transporter permease [Saprospiraceae bacterium]
MVHYIIRRLLYGILVLIMVIVVISSIIYLAPVDPERLVMGQRTDVGSLEAKRKELGLDQPLYIQLMWYLRDLSPIAVHENSQSAQEKYEYFPLLRFNDKALVIKRPYLRESFQSGRRVSEILWQAIPRTAILALSAILLATIAGILLGIVAALNQNTWIDNLAVVVSVLGYSLPSYVTAMILALVFGYYLGDLTGLNLQGPLTDYDVLLDKEVYIWKNLLLPAIALGIRPIGIITQLSRSTLLEVLQQDYIRTAKAKGLAKNKVIFKHALRNALNPVVTATTGWFAALLAGAFFVENVFNYNGLGLETVNALLNFDIPVVLGAVIFTSIAFVVINLFVDILYAILDPRVRLA